jgi:thiamine pyrophosphate-dependent acetolactate synthase large subunit-like protein
MEKNVCQFIVDHLAYQHRVRHIYGITGDALNALTAAIRKNETIQWVTTRHSRIDSKSGCVCWHNWSGRRAFN